MSNKQNDIFNEHQAEIKAEAKHTPTPFIINPIFKDKVGKVSAFQIYKDGKYFCEVPDSRWAEEIVRAVNSHEALLEALKDIANGNMDMKDREQIIGLSEAAFFESWLDWAKEKAEKAIAQAEGKGE